MAEALFPCYSSRSSVRVSSSATGYHDPSRAIYKFASVLHGRHAVNSKRIGGIYNIQHSFKDIIIHDFYRGRNVKNIPFFFVNNVKTEKLYQKIYDNVILHKKRQTNNSLIIYLQYETETLSLYQIIK